MHRPAQVPLDQTGFPLTLAGGLRTAFADVVSTLLPGRLAALAPIECRWRRTLRGGAQSWGKGNKNVEPY
jgi:hypothetical protein